MDEDDKRTTPSPPLTNSGGAFTALIKRNHAQPFSSVSHPHLIHPDQLSSSAPYKKSSDFLSGFPNNSSLQQQHSPQPHHAFNHALAAQLFLQQSPLIPQPSQWLYSQLYGNYNDMPWFRNSLPASASSAAAAAAVGLSANFRSSSSDEATEPPSDKHHARDPVARRAIKLVSHQQMATTEVATSSLPDDDEADASSPPVSSSRRSPSPSVGDHHEATSPTPADDDVEVVASGGRFGPIRHSPKMVSDVWRPY